MTPSILLLLLSVTLVTSSPVEGADQGDEKKEVTVVKTQNGLSFKLPPDWPIEERDGIVRPIPIEEYLAQKFAAVEKRVQRLEQQITSLEIRLRVLEEEMKKQQRLQSTESRSP